jgi:hypothetical protein
LPSITWTANRSDGAEAGFVIKAGEGFRSGKKGDYPAMMYGRGERSDLYVKKHLSFDSFPSIYILDCC